MPTTSRAAERRVRGSGAGSIRTSATAVLAALESGHTGIFNIVDDHPAPMSEWLPFLAGEIGAAQPRQVSAFLARMAVGSWGVAFMTGLRGASNARAKRILGWELTYPSWRTGFAAELGSEAATRRPA